MVAGLTPGARMTSTRSTEAAVDPMFPERWSPRSFLPDPVPPEQLESLFEAARWAPSCFNEQPWLFLYATEGEGLERMRQLLVDGNRAWADRAPVIGFVCARKHFASNGKPNRWGAFDSGSAFMSLALQAARTGLAVHGMGGFHLDRAHQVLGLDPDEFEVLAAFAVGQPGPAEDLPQELAARETSRSTRKPLSEVRRDLGRSD